MSGISCLIIAALFCLMFLAGKRLTRDLEGKSDFGIVLGVVLHVVGLVGLIYFAVNAVIIMPVK